MSILSGRMSRGIRVAGERSFCLLLLGGALLVALPSCEKEKPATPKPVREKVRTRGRPWPAITPAAAKLDEAKLKNLSDAVGGNGVVIRHDAIAWSWGEPARSLDVASAGKTVFVHLLFKAIELGKVAGLDEAVVKWEPNLATLNKALDHKDTRITWRDFANQTSGYGLTEAPGKAFAYNDFQTQLFWHVLFEKVYASTPELAADAVLKPVLFDLLEAEDRPVLRTLPEANITGRLVVSARDFARFGSVYLHGGKWQGKQVIDEKWVKLALNSPLPLSLPRSTGQDAEMLPDAHSFGGSKNQEDNLGSYSFMWWLNKPDAQGRLLWPDVPPDAFAAVGHGGIKVMMVIPSLDLIVSWNNSRLPLKEMCNGGREQINEALKPLVQAVLDP